MVTTHRLYTELGVTKSASASQIKRAYHALALKYHPDKAGDAGTEKFKSIQTAYAVLSDDGKRKMYDQVGDEGMSFVNGNGMGEFVSNPFFVYILSVVLFVLNLLALLFVSFVAVKVDGHGDWSWTEAFAPVWVFDGFLGLFLAHAIYSMLSTPNVRELLLDRAPMVLHLTCLFIAPILIVSWLDGHIASATAALLPVIALQLSKIVSTVRGLSKAAYEESCRASPELELVGYPIYLLLSVSTLVTPLVLALLCIRLDGKRSFSFFGVFSPYFVSVACQFVATFVLAGRQQRQQAQQQGEEAAPSVVASIIMSIVSTSVTCGIQLSFIVMLAQYLDGSTKRSFAATCTPLFIVLGVLQLLTCCMMSAARSGAVPNAGTEEENTSAGGAAGTEQPPQQESETTPLATDTSPKSDYMGIDD